MFTFYWHYTFIPWSLSLISCPPYWQKIYLQDTVKVNHYLTFYRQLEILISTIYYRTVVWRCNWIFKGFYFLVLFKATVVFDSQDKRAGNYFLNCYVITHHDSNYRAPEQRSAMACADVDMDIHGADEEPPGADWRAPPRIRYYQASEMMPDDKRPLHDLLQKQPAVLGVRNWTVFYYFTVLWNFIHFLKSQIYVTPVECGVFFFFYITSLNDDH